MQTLSQQHNIPIPVAFSIDATTEEDPWKAKDPDTVTVVNLEDTSKAARIASQTFKAKDMVPASSKPDMFGNTPQSRRPGARQDIMPNPGLCNPNPNPIMPNPALCKG